MSAADPVFWPVDPATVTEEAGTRGGAHWGMDFGIPVGTPVMAPFDGTVVWTGNDGASGYLASAGVWANGPALIMDIRRADGLICRFAHLSGFLAKQGQEVAAGDVVASSGNTGFTSGPHLHWELRRNRAFSPVGWVNPRALNPQSFAAKEVVIRKDTRMHAVRQIGQPDSGIIIGGGQPPRSRHNSVFVAECAALGITPVDCPDWQYGTVVREAWTDFATTTQYIAEAVAGKIPKGGVAPIGITDADAKKLAKAVNDDAAERLKN